MVILDDDRGGLFSVTVLLVFVVAVSFSSSLHLNKKQRRSLLDASTLPLKFPKI